MEHQHLLLCSADPEVLAQFPPVGSTAGSWVIDSTALTAALSTLHWSAPIYKGHAPGSLFTHTHTHIHACTHTHRAVKGRKEYNKNNKTASV